MNMEEMENGTSGFDIFDLIVGFLRVARRFWILALVLAILCAGVMSTVNWMSYTPMYKASVSFTVKVVNPLYADINAYNTKTVEQMEATFPYILTSTALQQKVKEHLGISYMPSVSAEALAGSNIFVMSVRDADPQRAYDVL